MFFLNQQKFVTKSRMTLKTTTNRGNNLQINRKVGEDTAETIKTISYSPQTLSMIC